MIIDNLVLFWIIVGTLLIASEFFVPGLVIIFPGFAALLVALGIHFDLLNDWPTIMGSWLGLSFALVVGLRRLAKRYLPGNTELGNMDEDLEAFGTTVQVLEIDPENPHKGRISYRGSSWDAECLDAQLEPGQNVRLIQRENLVWIVEEISDHTPTKAE